MLAPREPLFPPQPAGTFGRSNGAGGGGAAASAASGSCARAPGSGRADALDVGGGSGTGTSLLTWRGSEHDASATEIERTPRRRDDGRTTSTRLSPPRR